MKIRTTLIGCALVVMSIGAAVHAETIDTRIGKLDFELGVPTQETVTKLYDEMDFQRACQLYLWALPAVDAAHLRLYSASGFGLNKATALPIWCRECEVLAACRGGCPKHRFARTYYNEPGLHYLCAGYRNSFSASGST